MVINYDKVINQTCKSNLRTSLVFLDVQSHVKAILTINKKAGGNPPAFLLTAICQSALSEQGDGAYLFMPDVGFYLVAEAGDVSVGSPGALDAVMVATPAFFEGC